VVREQNPREIQKRVILVMDSVLSKETAMEDNQFLLHMDSAYDWRCFLCSRKGFMLAMSKGFFRLDDARRELERLRSAFTPVNDN
jgi:hypothetical protein